MCNSNVYSIRNISAEINPQEPDIGGNNVVDDDREESGKDSGEDHFIYH